MSRQEQIQFLMENEVDLARREVEANPSSYENAVNELESSLASLQLLGRPSQLVRAPRRAPRRALAPPAPVAPVNIGCQFTLTRGARRGQPCGNVYHSSSPGYCRRHGLMLRNQQSVEALPPSLVRPVIHFEEESKIDQSDLIYEPCHLCNSKVDGAKVQLECGCEYHLNCYLIIQNETHCMKCGDKINKTEEDYEDCSICLEKLKTGTVKTKCGHKFHKDCINSWVQMGVGLNCDKCPNCRGNL